MIASKWDETDDQPHSLNSLLPVPKNSFPMCGTKPKRIFRFFGMNLNRFHAAFQQKAKISVKFEIIFSLETYIFQQSIELSQNFPVSILGNRRPHKRILLHVPSEY
jgi:hypothetical protein